MPRGGRVIIATKAAALLVLVPHIIIVPRDLPASRAVSSSSAALGDETH